MKKLLIFAFTIVMVFAIQPVYAMDSVDSSSIEYLDDGSYYLTVIEDASSDEIAPFSTTTKTKSKTTYFKNANGTTLWYVRVTGTFTYGNGTATCTKVIPSAVSKSSSWKVSTPTGKRSGNKASATATGKHYVSGIVTNSKTKTVTLTCSPTGNFS